MNADRLGIGVLGTFALPPVEIVHLVADLGCRYMSTVVAGTPQVPFGCRPFSLQDSGLRNDLRAHRPCAEAARRLLSEL